MAQRACLRGPGSALQSNDVVSRDTHELDAVVRKLQIIGEAVKGLPDDVRAGEPSIEWRKIAGLRDVLVHAYFGVDEEIVWDVVRTKLPKLEKAERLMAQHLPLA